MVVFAEVDFIDCMNPFLDRLLLTKLRFRIRAESDLYLPVFKGAVFRGGFGYIFKNIVCPTHDTNCIHSRLGERCVFDDVFNTPVPPNSAVMRKYPYAPHPFVLTPPLDARTRVPAGDTLALELVLIGRGISRLPYFIHTLEELGRRGIGVQKSRYAIERIDSLKTISNPGESFLVYDGRKRTIEAEPYIFGCRDFENENSGTQSVTITLLTPVRIVSDQRLTTELTFSTIFRSLLRRIALLSYFHCGVEPDVALMRRLINDASSIRVFSSALNWKDWVRFSTRQKTHMKLGGLVGRIVFEGNLEPFIGILRAGELAHVGKGTSFGLGSYALERATA